jgi:acyl-CoA thioesterase-1
MKFFLVSLGLLASLTLHTSSTFAKTKVLFLGDSLTAGYGIAKEQAYPSLIEQSLEKSGYKNVIIVNAGISGSTTASGISRLKWHMRAEPKPSIVVLALGANDGLRGQVVQHSKKKILDTIKFAKSEGMQVILAGMKIPPNYGAQYTKDFEKMFQDIAEKEKVVLIPFLLEGVAARKELNIADGIHPNEKGHEIIAKTVLKYLTPLLKKGAQ